MYIPHETNDAKDDSRNGRITKDWLTPYEPPFTYSGVNYHKILKISPPKINISPPNR